MVGSVSSHPIDGSAQPCQEGLPTAAIWGVAGSLAGGGVGELGAAGAGAAAALGVVDMLETEERGAIGTDVWSCRSEDREPTVRMKNWT